MTTPTTTTTTTLTPAEVAVEYRFSGYQFIMLELDETGPAYIYIKYPHPYYINQPQDWTEPFYGNPGNQGLYSIQQVSQVSQISAISRSSQGGQSSGTVTRDINKTPKSANKIRGFLQI